MTGPDRAARALRRRLLSDIYGPEAGSTAASSIDDLVDGAMARGDSTLASRSGWDENDLWLIAYPDHVREPGRRSLATLAELLAGPLAGLATGVHVLPLHPATSDGGFAVADYDVVDPSFGSWSDVERLAEAVDVMADAVVNHTSASHPWFRGFLAGEAARSGWYRVPDPNGDLGPVVRPRTSPLITTFELSAGGEVDVWTTFSADQVDLDVRTPDVVVALCAVLLNYVAHGAGVLRLDAIAYLAKQEGTPSIHLPDTHRVVQVWRSALGEASPGTLVVTETNVAHVENLSYLGDGEIAEADMVYQFALPPLVLHTLTTGDPAALVEWSPLAATPWPGTTTLSFLASHDGVGVRPLEGLVDPVAVEALAALTERAGGVVNRYRHGSGEDRPYELAAAWFSLMDGDVDPVVALARHLAAHALMLALPGVPLVYLHSLLATPNDTVTFAATGHGRDLNRARLDRAVLWSRLGEPDSLARRSLDGISALVAARRSSPAFHPEAPHRVSSPEPGVVLVERVGFGGEEAAVWIEVAGRPVAVPGRDARWVAIPTRDPLPAEVRIRPFGSVWAIRGQPDAPRRR